MKIKGINSALSDLLLHFYSHCCKIYLLKTGSQMISYADACKYRQSCCPGNDADAY